MRKIDFLFKARRISKIVETEKERYLNFFSKSYMDNLEHSNFSLEKFPRWSIISGYYAMHDITKLFLAKNFNLKINFRVHETTLLVLREIIKDRKILELLELGYNEFIEMASDLAEARKERTKVQYYTGTKFMKEKYREKAKVFSKKIVLPYIGKIKKLL